MSVSPPINTSKKLRRARRELGLTQDELARKLDLSWSSVAKMESKSPFNRRPISRRTDLAIRYLLLVKE